MKVREEKHVFYESGEPEHISIRFWYSRDRGERWEIEEISLNVNGRTTVDLKQLEALHALIGAALEGEGDV